MKYDEPIEKIAAYAVDYAPYSERAYTIALYSLFDSLGCAIRALRSPECQAVLEAHLGSMGDVAVPGFKKLALFDSRSAAWNIAALIRWLDYNDAWLAKEWGHPSDNIGAILALAQKEKFSVRDVLTAMIKAHEIQGGMALENSFNERGIDHVILVKLASAAVCASMLTNDIEAVKSAISHVFADGASLRVYRHAPNVTRRKSWAAADAARRGLELAFMAVYHKEPGLSQVLTTKQYGFYDAMFGGKEFVVPDAFGSQIMENILFKVYPAEYHGQTAIEAAVRLHAKMPRHLEDITKIRIWTQNAAMRIINKDGSLVNEADRDHCIQYMVAAALLDGDITPESYSDKRAEDPRIDFLRSKMEVKENNDFTKWYYDPNNRAVANSVQLVFADGSVSREERVLFPLGHPRRRDELHPALVLKLRNNLRYFGIRQTEQILSIMGRLQDFSVQEKMTVTDLIGHFCL